MTAAVDVLFVDEAGQISLANVVAMSPARPTASCCSATRSSSTSRCRARIRPAPSGRRWPTSSATRRRSPPDRGLFLETTWRLHPDLCAFTSEVFYDEPARAGAASRRPAAPDRRGLRRWRRPAVARRSRPSAPTTSRRSRRPRSRGLGASSSRAARPGPTRRRRPAARLAGRPRSSRRTTPRSARSSGCLPPEARVGTVDKFQGQEAPISIYSLTTSTPELAPRGMDFLYSRHRLNVATSRARCVAVVVGSPDLLRVRARTPEQMRLANAFCRFAELASERRRRADGERDGRRGPDARPGLTPTTDPPTIGRRAASRRRRPGALSPARRARSPSAADGLVARRGRRARQHGPHRRRDGRDDRRRRTSPAGTTAWSGAPAATVVVSAPPPAPVALSRLMVRARPADRARRRATWSASIGRARRDGRDRRDVAAAAARRHGADRLRQRVEPAVALRRRRPVPAGSARVGASALVVWGATVGAVIGPNLVGAARRRSRSHSACPSSPAPTSSRSCSSARRRSCRSSLLRPDPYELADDSSRHDQQGERSAAASLARASSPARTCPSRSSRSSRSGRDGPDHDDDAAPHDRPRPRPGRGRHRDQRPHVRDVRAVADLRAADRSIRERAGRSWPGSAVVGRGLHPRRGRPAGRRRPAVPRPVPAGLRLEPGLRRRVGAAHARPVARRADAGPGPDRRADLELGGGRQPRLGDRRRGCRLRDPRAARRGARDRPGCWSSRAARRSTAALARRARKRRRPSRAPRAPRPR